MDEKKVYMTPALEEVESSLFRAVAQGASGIPDSDDNTGEI